MTNEELARGIVNTWWDHRAIVRKEDLELINAITKILNQKDLDHQVEIEKLKYDKRCCPCGGTILADTDGCKVPVCCECVIEISKAYLPKDQNYNEGFSSGVQSKVKEIAALKADLKLKLDKAREFIKSECYCEMDGDIAMHCSNCDLLKEIDL